MMQIAAGILIAALPLAVIAFGLVGLADPQSRDLRGLWSGILIAGLVMAGGIIYAATNQLPAP